MKSVWVVFVSLLLLVLILLPSCSTDDDDDDSAGDNSSDDDASDDDSIDDDDDSTDDDADDDDTVDDDTVDDDTADDDDDTGDDDDDDDTGPTYLMVLGKNEDGHVSYRQTEKGWLEQAIPNPSIGWPPAEFGPISFTGGERGYGVWNQYGDMATVGHGWLDYYPDSGWILNIKRPQAHLGAVVTVISAYAAAGHLWASSYRWEIFFNDNYLYRYSGETHEQQLSGYTKAYHSALYFFDAANGYLAGENDIGGYLVRYVDGEWQWVGMPAGFENGQYFWLELIDMENGFGIAKSNDGVLRVLRMTDGVWTPVPAPSGCEAIFPEAVIGDENHAVAFRYSRTEDRFWEFQDGQWSCHQLDLGADSLRTFHATVWRDGRLFMVGKQEGIVPVLYEVHADSVTEMELPAEMTNIFGVFAIGSQAPRQANWRLTF